MSGGMEDSSETVGDAQPGFYHQLQAITSRALATPPGDRRDIVDELLTVLSDKQESSHLTTEETLLQSALLALQCNDAARSIGGLDADAYSNVIQTHLANTFNANASALNSTAYLAYASLLLSLHYAYVGTEPVDNEITLLDFPASEAKDIVQEWTGFAGGPAFYPDGRYDGSTLVGPIKKYLAAANTAEWDALLGTSSVREQLRAAYSRLSGDVANVSVERACSHHPANTALFAPQSHLFWSLYHQFEVTHSPPSPSPDEVELLQGLYLARLRSPHAAIELTLQSYSTFVTKYLPAKDYENAMTNAYKLVGPAKEAWSACEAHETQLASQLRQQGASGYSRWAAWKGYVSWSSSTFLQSHQRRGGPKVHLDVESVCAIFERAIASCGLPPSCTDELMANGRSPLASDETARQGKGGKASQKQREEEELKAEQEAAVDVWKRYLVFLSTAKASSTIASDVCTRASKAVPSSGFLHAQIIRSLCRQRRGKAHIDEYFSISLSNNGIYSTAASIVELVLAWLDAQREIVAGDMLLKGGAQDLSEAIGLLRQDTDGFMEVYSMMSFALNLLEERGVIDEELHLEQLMSEWCTQGPGETAALVETIWDKALHIQVGNSLAWQGASRYYAQRGIYKKARSLLRQGLGRKEITSDKKVILAEELVKMEHVFGGAVEIEWALARRDTERESSWNEYYATYATSHEQQEQQRTAPEVEMADGAGVREKRKAGEENGSAAGYAAAAVTTSRGDKRGRESEAPAKAVRDRENSSVLVDLLPADATQEDILTLFKDCGEIREIVGPKVIESSTDRPLLAAALVEFTSRESIPAARSRQLKVLRSSQVDISMGWECTLYVTNFSPEYDADDRMRQLFSPHGPIFDIRWPSKKFASSRRFCYVQFCNTQSAHSALRLHEMEMKSDDSSDTIKMQVFLSDPNRKKIRSDAQASERELFLSGLPKGISEEELKAVLGESVERVRLPRHPDGNNKSFAFVDMRTALDAQAALGHAREAEGGYRLKGKLITLSTVDKGKGTQASLSGAEKKSHSIRVRGLPLDAQEAVIQQVIESQAGIQTVKRVDWTPGEAGRGVAIVEFHDVAVAGRVALMAALSYDDAHPLRLSTLEYRGAAANMPSTGTATAGPASFAPRQAARGRGRGRGGLGFARRPPVFASPTAPAEATGSSPTTDMDVDRVDREGARQPKTQDAFREMLRGGK